MSVSRTNGEIDGLVAELEKVGREASEVFGSLSPAQLNWKPSAEQWSVGQCFDHLIVTNSSFFPDLRRVAAGTFQSSLWGRISPLSGFFGRYILSALDPAKGRKIKAPPAFLPAKSDVDADVIDRHGARHLQPARRVPHLRRARAQALRAGAEGNANGRVPGRVNL